MRPAGHMIRGGNTSGEIVAPYLDSMICHGFLFRPHSSPGGDAPEIVRWLPIVPGDEGL